MNILKKIIVLLLFIMPLALMSQGSKIGVRAGLNYSWYDGPVEEGESFSTSSGFHFGINYSYYFSKYFGLRGELLYNQKGTVQNYQGEAYYVLRRGAERIVDYGNVIDYKLEDSNAYLSLPISASAMITNDFEIYGGVSFEFLIGPRGAGVLDYKSTVNPEGIFFIQSFDNNYYEDNAASASIFSTTTIALIVEEERLDIPRIAAAYYFFDEKISNKYRVFDMGLHAGANYFINTGFFVGLNFNYGLIDPTKRQMDVSIRELNDFDTFTDDAYIRRDDKDHQLSVQASIGFRF